MLVVIEKIYLLKMRAIDRNSIFFAHSCRTLVHLSILDIFAYYIRHTHTNSITLRVYIYLYCLYLYRFWVYSSENNTKYTFQFVFQCNIRKVESKNISVKDACLKGCPLEISWVLDIDIYLYYNILFVVI